MGIFGDMFDFNRDGELDAFEKSAEFGAFMNMIEQEESEEENEEEDFQLKHSEKLTRFAECFICYYV